MINLTNSFKLKWRRICGAVAVLLIFLVPATKVILAGGGGGNKGKNQQQHKNNSTKSASVSCPNSGNVASPMAPSTGSHSTHKKSKPKSK